MNKKIEQYQLDMSNKSQSIELLKKLQAEEALIIGIEVTDVETSRYAHICIDPQHSHNVESNITAIEMVYQYRDRLKKMMSVFQKCALITIKPDIDSIGAMVIAKLCLSGDWEMTGDNLLRVMAIANSDRHGGGMKWNKRKKTSYFNNPLFSRFGLPIGLLSAIGMVGLDISTKLAYMEEYILTGTFTKIDKFTANTLKKNADASSSVIIDTVVDNKLVFVESGYRGAIGLGYRHAPVVLAKNPNYRFGKDGNIRGTKYTLAQFNINHIDFEKILIKLVELEPGWGGDIRSIIGSPLDSPSKLEKEQILDIVKNEL